MSALIGLIAGLPQHAWSAEDAGKKNSGKSAKVEKAVRERTQQFYSTLQAGQTEKAVEFITKAGRDRYRSEPSAAFLNFRILSADVHDDLKSATVVVEINVMSTYMGGIMPFQRTLDWVMEDRDWRIRLPEAAVVGNDSLLAMGKGLGMPDRPEELKFQTHSFDFGVMKHGERKEVRFPFTNGSDHPVKIAQIATGCDCLKIKTQKMDYKPGESGEVVLDFDSSNYEFEYAQTVVVKTNPGGISSYLLVKGNVVSQAIVDSQNRARARSATQSTPESQPITPLNHQ